MSDKTDRIDDLALHLIEILGEDDADAADADLVRLADCPNCGGEAVLVLASLAGCLLDELEQLGVDRRGVLDRLALLVMEESTVT